MQNRLIIAKVIKMAAPAKKVCRRSGRRYFPDNPEIEVLIAARNGDVVLLNEVLQQLM